MERQIAACCSRFDPNVTLEHRPAAPGWRIDPPYSFHEVCMSVRTLLLFPLLVLMIVATIIGGIVGGLFFLTPRLTTISTAATPATPVDTSVSANAPQPTLQPEQTELIDSEDQLLVALFQERSPAVVSIRVQSDAPEGSLQFDLPEQSPAPDASPLPQDPFQFEAQGTGFVIDGDGHIVTNNHVVEGAKLIDVTFTNGLTVNAEIVGTDFDSDLAVLKVEQLPDGVQPLPLGDSKQVQVGQRAVAIGNPFGLATTLTVGVVSARGRTVENRLAAGGGVFSIADVIQTDAAINPGNSGGPLFNSRGEVIGVNTAIRSEGGTFEGVGFAVPSNTVKKVTTALIETGRYEHPYLGISFYAAPLTDPVARELGLPISRGVFVSGVAQGGPSERAGLQGPADLDDVRVINGDPYPIGGDIITRIDSREVSSSRDIIDYLATDTEVGQTVTLTILRDGQEQQLQLTLGARPAPEDE
jgi:2-alkenal reductase